MRINYHLKDRLIQAFIVGILFIIILAYYQIEISTFPYTNYKMAVALFKKHDAELNESLVLSRVGVLKQYDTVVAALEGMYDTLAIFKKELEATPNATLSEGVSKLEKLLIQKDRLVTEFKRLNPILINATNDFSKVMSEIIESETQADVVERFSIQNYNPEHYEFLNKLNALFRDTLIYTGGTQSEEMYRTLANLILEIKNSPTKVDNINLAIQYAEVILVSKKKINAIEAQILSLRILSALDNLTHLYDHLRLEYNYKTNAYQYLFYILSISLLVIVHFAFKRLQNIVHKLDESNQKLEERVAQRTQDLANKNEDLNKALDDLHDAQDQLIVKEKMASVGMLTTGIAHEIKNPLNFINNFSEMSSTLSLDLKNLIETEKTHLPEALYTELQELSSDIESNCKKIQDYGTRADNIVNSMLQHSKEASVQKENTKIQPLVENAAELAIHSYKTQHPGFDVELQTQFDPTLKEIFIAPQAISQALVLILNNACWAISEHLKANPSLSPLIKITTQRKDNTAVLSFFDNGLGIPEKNLMKVFEPFFTTRPTGFGNTGLGLSICYDIIVKQHKGTFSVTSIEGQHTEFTITLPITHQDAI